MSRRDLLGAQWATLQPMLPSEKPRRGRPDLSSRAIREGISWSTGAPWRDLPPRYRKWNGAGTMSAMKRATAVMLNDLMISIGDQLAESLDTVREQEPGEFHQKYARTVGDILGITLYEVMNPLYARFPDLEPEELRRPGSPERDRPFKATHRLHVSDDEVVEVMLYAERGGFAHTREQWESFQRGECIPAPFWQRLEDHWWRHNERLDRLHVEPLD